MDVDSLHREGGKRKKGKGKGENKCDRCRHDNKDKGDSQSNNDTLMGIAIRVVSMDTRNQSVRVRTNSSKARVTNVEHVGTRVLTVLLKRWHNL